MQTELLLAGVVSILVTILSLPIIRVIAPRKGLYDEIEDRKVHKNLTPRIGGVAIALAVLVNTLLFVDISRPAVTLMLAAIILFVTGIVDDLRGLKPLTKLSAQVLAAIVVLGGGIGIIFVSMPFSSGLIFLDGWQIPVEILGLSFNILPIANLFTIAWIILIINAVNLLDGLDGLAGGISLIGFVTLLSLAIGSTVTGLVLILSVTMCMSLLAFLTNNFYPARIFMGDSGSYLIGVMMAGLPIYSTVKTTVGVVVIGIAIVDLVWAVLRRLKNRQSPFKADRGHIHHRLLDNGIEHRNVVIIFYLVALIVSLTVTLAGLAAAVAVLTLSLFAVVIVTKNRKSPKQMQ